MPNPPVDPTTYPKSWRLFMDTPGMTWGHAIAATGEYTPEADRLAAHVLAVAERSAKSTRQREYDDLRWQAKLAGRSDAEAAQMARVELAQRHGEPVKPEDMSPAEAEASVRSFDSSVLGIEQGHGDDWADDLVARQAIAEAEREYNNEVWAATKTASGPGSPESIAAYKAEHPRPMTQYEKDANHRATLAAGASAGTTE